MQLPGKLDEVYAAEHTACAAVDMRWTSLDGVETDSFPGHPTPLGHEAMAQAVEAAILR